MSNVSDMAMGLYGPLPMELAPLPSAFYRRPAAEVAPDLLGRLLVRRLGEELLVVRLVEVEAYLGAPDRASHAWGGRRTRRNESLYLTAGHAYVYFIYGMHWCLNAVCGEADVEEAPRGGAVLLRAAEPLRGETAMRARRRLADRVRPGDVAGGPGKLCQALGIDRALDGVPLTGPELWIAAGEPLRRRQIASGPRIGVAYAGEAAAWPLRFAAAGNPHVSRPRL
ncbi:MAG TPA: DNA-3-methyladenine glycosylase [Thermoanaerobaculia bacterium]|nr:DNA-3-methyladenine glycosylase [Thermoanaerobaculia bacterium]